MTKAIENRRVLSHFQPREESESTPTAADKAIDEQTHRSEQTQTIQGQGEPRNTKLTSPQDVRSQNCINMPEDKDGDCSVSQDMDSAVGSNLEDHRRHEDEDFRQPAGNTPDGKCKLCIVRLNSGNRTSAENRLRSPTPFPSVDLDSFQWPPMSEDSFPPYDLDSFQLPPTPPLAKISALDLPPLDAAGPCSFQVWLSESPSPKLPAERTRRSSGG